MWSPSSWPYPFPLDPLMAAVWFGLWLLRTTRPKSYSLLEVSFMNFSLDMFDTEKLRSPKKTDCRSLKKDLMHCSQCLCRHGVLLPSNLQYLSWWQQALHGLFWVQRKIPFFPSSYSCPCVYFLLLKNFPSLLQHRAVSCGRPVVFPWTLKCNWMDWTQGQIYPVSPSCRLIPFPGCRGIAPTLCSGIFRLSHSKWLFPCWWLPTAVLWALLPRVDGWDRFLLQTTENRLFHRCGKLKQL